MPYVIMFSFFIILLIAANVTSCEERNLCDEIEETGLYNIRFDKMRGGSCYIQDKETG